MSDLPLEVPHLAGPGVPDETAGAATGRELSADELAAALRQSAEQGWRASRDIIRLVARRIEEAELDLLRIGQGLF